MGNAAGAVLMLSFFVPVAVCILLVKWSAKHKLREPLETHQDYENVIKCFPFNGLR